MGGDEEIQVQELTLEDTLDAIVVNNKRYFPNLQSAAFLFEVALYS